MRVNMLGLTMPGSFLPQRVKNIIEGVRAPRISRTRTLCTVAACAISSTVFATGTLERAVLVVPLPAPRLLVAQQPRFGFFVSNIW